jgi:hypothetical protein
MRLSIVFLYVLFPHGLSLILLHDVVRLGMTCMYHVISLRACASAELGKVAYAVLVRSPHALTDACIAARHDLYNVVSCAVDHLF